MDNTLHMNRTVPSFDDLVNGVWTPNPAQDASHGQSYMEVNFSDVTWWTAVEITPVLQDLLALEVKIRLEYKTSSSSDYEIVNPSGGDSSDRTLRFGDKLKLPDDPKIEVTDIRLTLLSYPDYQNSLQLVVDFFGCTLRGKYC